MTLYFQGLTSEQDIKARYKSLAKEHHPDLGGCLETMKIINAQYDKVLTGAYQSQGKSITEIDELLEKDTAIRNQVIKVIHLEGLIVEICGSWIWITGDTKRHKDALKTAKFLWSPKKLCWYWRSEAKKGWFYRGNTYDLEAIRYKHGSINIPRREFASIN
jgi:hypothetical protein